MRRSSASCFAPLLVAGCLLQAACPADLGRFSIAGERGSDGDGGSTGGGGDGGVPASATCGGGPYLLALLASDSTSVKSGSVLRIPLDQGPLPKRCPPLTAGGTIASYYATSLAWLPPDTVAIGSLEGLQLVDSTDVQVAYYQQMDVGSEGTFPIALAPLVDGKGTRYLAVAYNYSNTDSSDTAKHVEVFDLPNLHKKQFDWGCDSSWTFSPDTIVITADANVTGMVESPWDPTHLLFASRFDPDIGASDVAAPFDGTPVQGKQLVGAPGPQGRVATLHADRVRAGVVRYAWVMTNYSPDHDYVWTATDTSSDGSAPAVRGPFNCGDMRCASQRYADAVADPTNDGKVIAICDDASTTSSHTVRHIVRFDGSSCELLLDGSTFVDPQYPIALALAGLP